MRPCGRARAKVRSFLAFRVSRQKSVQSPSLLLIRQCTRHINTFSPRDKRRCGLPLLCRVRLMSKRYGATKVFVATDSPGVIDEMRVSLPPRTCKKGFKSRARKLKCLASGLMKRD